MAAAEEIHKGLLEGLVDELKLFSEDGGHLPGDLLDNTGKLSLGLLHVVPLAGQIGVTGIHPVKFLNGPHIYRTKGCSSPRRSSLIRRLALAVDSSSIRCSMAAE